jgi:hypothetical protein
MRWVAMMESHHGDLRRKRGDTLDRQEVHGWLCTLVPSRTGMRLQDISIISFQGAWPSLRPWATLLLLLWLRQ